ncbi:MAG: hypothetical protein JW795_14555 [Chitinivibrionales bacterium]|nr:hypothetical protein [Chitinivibrionales bacterium]
MGISAAYKQGSESVKKIVCFYAYGYDCTYGISTSFFSVPVLRHATAPAAPIQTPSCAAAATADDHRPTPVAPNRMKGGFFRRNGQRVGLYVVGHICKQQRKNGAG